MKLATSRYTNVPGVGLVETSSLPGYRASGDSTYSIDPTTQNYYDTASGTYNTALNQAGLAQQYNAGLSSNIDDFAKEYEDFKSTYSPYLTSALQTAGEEYAAKRQALQDLQGAKTADYSTEAGQAMTDVAAAAQRAQEENARSLARAGVSMASGRAQTLQSQNALTAALAGAAAGTKARQDAANTAYSQGLQTYNAANPATSINSALGISNQQAGLLTQKANIAEQQAQNANSIAGTMSTIGSGQAGLASNYGNLGLGYDTLNQTAKNQRETLDASGWNKPASVYEPGMNGGTRYTMNPITGEKRVVGIDRR